MKNVVTAAALVFTAAVILQSAEKASAESQSGEALFKQNCVSCHPQGGNIINPRKTLHKKSREANNLKTAGDIVKVMRNPGPGMTKFDQKTLPDDDAGKIANYVVNAFR